MKACKCEHWQRCPVCMPHRFDSDGNLLPPEPTPLQAARNRIEELERERDALQADNAELVAALESVEWTWLGKMPEGNCCCYCGALKKHGHVTGCKVANVLKRTTLAQALAKLRKP